MVELHLKEERMRMKLKIQARRYLDAYISRITDVIGSMLKVLDGNVRLL
jgi:hypothetical protein